MIVLKKYEDASHGWLAVKRDFAKQVLGDKFKDISPCSYQSRGTGAMLYLEEDCDMSLFLNEAEKQGYVFHIIKKHMEGLRRCWVYYMSQFKNQ